VLISGLATSALAQLPQRFDKIRCAAIFREVFLT
jgi:hypothetical protein